MGERERLLAQGMRGGVRKRGGLRAEREEGISQRTDVVRRALIGGGRR
ncbi:hypothetical protein [Bartonella sp. OT172YNZD]